MNWNYGSIKDLLITSTQIDNTPIKNRKQ